MKPFSIEIPNCRAWADNFWGIWGSFGRFISTHFGTVSPLSLFSINSKYLFGIWIWATKNQGFRHHVSVVRCANDENCLLSNLDAGESQYSLWSYCRLKLRCLQTTICKVNIQKKVHNRSLPPIWIPIQINLSFWFFCKLSLDVMAIWVAKFPRQG